jgi:hypothetical protein
VRDVTPASALQAAESLEAGNDRAAMEIANRMFPRWMWMHLDMEFPGRVASLRSGAPELVKKFQDAVDLLAMPKCAHVRLDIVDLLLFIHAHLRRENECILENALHRLTRWSTITNYASGRPLYKKRGARKVGSLDSLAQLFKGERPAKPS